MNKLSSLVILAISAICVTAYADSTLTVEGVHNCCKKCEKGITAAVTSVDGATAAIDKTTVTITAKSDADAKKAAEALGTAGYYGKGIDAPATVDSAKTNSATMSGLHLCCKKCAEAVNKTAASVSGVTECAAEKDAKEVIVNGEFSKADLQAALLKAGFEPIIK